VVALRRTSSPSQTRALTAGLIILIVAAFALLPMTAEAGKKSKGIYKPPYKKGPQGGDWANFTHADHESGEMSIVRVFPGIPPVVGCIPEAHAGWAMFRVKHRVQKPVRAVTVHYEAALDGYSWVTVGARGENKEWLGVKKFQGPQAGSGKLTAKLFDHPQRGDTITLEFGLQLGDACPQVGGAAASFPKVQVKT
jgi:hypothetical protein